MASLDFETESGNFKEWYAQSHSSLRAAEKTYRKLLQTLLENTNNLPTPKITSRLKDRDECINKFCRKYQLKKENAKENYEIKNNLTDIIGIRIICLYESNIDIVVKELKSNFKLLDETNKTKELESQDNKVGYKGLHLDLKLDDTRASLLEYENLKNFSFEVQIRTIAQDAWSEIDHKLKYKKDLPKILKRRVYILAGLFELADREFDSLREEKEKLVQEGLEKNRNKNSEQPLNPFNFLKLANSYYSTYHFNEEHIEEFVEDIRNIKSKVTLDEVEKAMKDHYNTVENYKHWCLKNVGKNLNPYSEIRHALYLSHKENFDNLMFNGVKKRFNTWIVDEKIHSKKT